MDRGARRVMIHDPGDHGSKGLGSHDPRSIELIKDTRTKATGIRRRLWDAWVDSFPLDLDLQQSTSVLGFIARSSNQTRL